MQDIATATLSGNLTRDVDLRTLPSGTDVARLRVASTARRRNGEEWVDKTNYFTVEIYGAQARACAQYLTRGSRVFIDAELDWRQWTDEREHKREAVTLKARHVLFEGARTTSNGADANANATDNHTPAARTAPPASTTVSGTASPRAAVAAPATEDDLPF